MRKPEDARARLEQVGLSLPSGNQYVKTLLVEILERLEKLERLHIAAEDLITHPKVANLGLQNKSVGFRLQDVRDALSGTTQVCNCGHDGNGTFRCPHGNIVPGGGAQQDEKPLGKFDHHPDPAIDFCIEVEAVENLASDIAKGMAGPNACEELRDRIDRAMAFRVGGDAGAVAAKNRLRELTGKAQQDRTRLGCAQIGCGASAVWRLYGAKPYCEAYACDTHREELTADGESCERLESTHEDSEPKVPGCHGYDGDIK